MKRSLLSLLVTTCLALSPAFALESSKPNTGLHRFNPRVHALVNATVVTKPGSRIEKANIVIREGVIETVGENVAIPQDARIWDLSGKTVYAGFIDAYSHFGMPEGLKPFVRKPQPPGAPAQKASPTPKTPGAAYWNELVAPERLAETHFIGKKSQAEKLSDIGLTTVATYPGRGIFRAQAREPVFSLRGGSLGEPGGTRRKQRPR